MKYYYVINNGVNATMRWAENIALTKKEVHSQLCKLWKFYHYGSTLPYKNVMHIPNYNLVKRPTLEQLLIAFELELRSAL